MWRSSLVQSICFEFPFNLAEAKQKAQAMTSKDKSVKIEEEKIPSSNLPDTTCWGVFSDDESILMGNIIVNNYSANFDGKLVRMGGIGGVATLPQYRHMGVIRSCFQKALLDMYENDFVLSALYPFSRTYYRQFGYENGPYMREITINLASLKTQFVGGSIQQLLPGDNTQVLLEIYREFYQKYNFAVYRKEYDKELNLDSLLEQKRYIYVWRDENGVPRGFCIAKKTENRVFNCVNSFVLHNAFLALDARAYQALFHFIRTSFASDYSTIQLSVPNNVHLDSLIVASNGLEINLYYNGMIRVINCQKALELSHYKGNGSIIMEIIDDQIPQNNGIWRIDFADGKSQLVTKTTQCPDISLPVSAFSALICGIRTAEDLSMMPEVIVYNTMAPFASIFYTKPCHITEFF